MKSKLGPELAGGSVVLQVDKVVCKGWPLDGWLIS